MASTDSLAKYPPSYLEANSSSNLYAATTIILVLCTILLCLRLWARHLSPAGRGWDDYFLVPSYLCFLAVCILMYIAIPRAGIGRHLPVVLAEDPHKLEMWNFVIYLLDWFYVPSNMLSRVSVVMLYLRIFTSKISRGFCWAVIAFLIANCLAFIISANLECIPLQRTWNKHIEGTCFNVELWWKLSNIPNVFADVAILCLPLPTIWNLKAGLTKRLGIWMVFLTGSVGLVASCARTAAFFSALAKHPPDPTWTSSPLLAWTVVECGMYNSAACLVCLKPLYGRLPKFIRDRWTVWEHSHGSSERSRAEVPGIQMNSNRKRHGNEIRTDSSSCIVRSDLEEGNTSEDQISTHREDIKPTVAWNSISVDTTFEVSSAHQNRRPEEYKYSVV